MIARIFLLLALLAMPAAADEVVRLVYLGVEEDSRYEPEPVYTGLSLRDVERPLDGLRLGLRDTRVMGRALGVSFEIEERIVKPGEAASALTRAPGEPAPLAVILDLPPDEMEAALSVTGVDDILFNIRDGARKWRDTACLPQLLHTVPSDAMLSDALAQHLRAKGWTDVLLLHGPTPEEAALAETARRSATKFGLRITETRAFELTNDPRRRDQSNLALLTSGPRHDVIWLIDSLGDFGRFLPFATYAPRPVVGSEGLTPRAWHWTFERYGAPQLNQRFRRLADRDMTSGDWAAWAAVRAVADAVTMVRSADRTTVGQALRSQALSVDLYKGVRGNFREWNGQLRQPILLTTHNAVISVAPLEGFEHQVDTLDTLGLDSAETSCGR